MQRANVPVLAVALAAGAALACDKEDAWKLQASNKPVFGPIMTARDFAAPGGGGGQRDEFPRVNIELLAWIPLNNFEGNNSSGADCWGYTSPGGREYALIGLRNGTAVVEATDPVNPVIVDFVPGASSLWHDVTVIGHYAYACTDVEAGMGIQVIDLSRVDEGIVRLVGERRPGGINTIHTLLSNPESGHLYACGANIANGGCVALSVNADPESPAIVGAWTNTYVHECQALTYPSGPYAGRELVYLFAAQSGLYIVDFTDKANPVTLDGNFYPDTGYCHQGWLTSDLKYLYMDDELDEYWFGKEPSTHLFNVEDPTNSQWLGTLPRNHNSIDHNLYVKGTTLYESNYREGLHIYDISDPLNRVEIASIDTYPNGDGIDFSGNWGNYPFFASGTIVLSDINRGLFLVRLDLPCTADFDGNGVLNIFDFLAFQTAFGNDDPAADLAEPFGVLNVFDFLAFQAAFGEGC